MKLMREIIQLPFRLLQLIFGILTGICFIPTLPLLLIFAKTATAVPSHGRNLVMALILLVALPLGLLVFVCYFLSAMSGVIARSFSDELPAPGFGGNVFANRVREQVLITVDSIKTNKDTPMPGLNESSDPRESEKHA